MAKGTKGSKFHPARISGIQKQLRQREAALLMQPKKKPKFVPLDTTKGDWTMQKPK